MIVSNPEAACRKRHLLADSVRSRASLAAALGRPGPRHGKSASFRAHSTHTVGQKPTLAGDRFGTSLAERTTAISSRPRRPLGDERLDGGQSHRERVNGVDPEARVLEKNIELCLTALSRAMGDQHVEV